jgi:hypothetical protein
MIVALLASVALLAEAVPAAQPTEPAAPPVSGKQKLSKKGMICRNESVIGSKLPRRVCLTPEQDAERRQQDRELTEYMQHSTRVGCGAVTPGTPCPQ